MDDGSGMDDTDDTPAVAGWAHRPGYLDTAAYGLPHPASAAAMNRWTAEWTGGATAYPDWLGATDEARQLFALLAGVPEDRVCTGVTGSQLVGQLATSLPDGSRVLAAADEFPSLLFPFLAQADRGVRVREVPIERIADEIDATTDVVALSAVSPMDGRLAPLGDIRRAAAATGARTVVDAAQACGWLAEDWSRYDAVVVPGFKWLCALRGVAFMALSDRMLGEQRPSSAGWFAGVRRSAGVRPLRQSPDARSLDLSPVWSSWAAAREGLRALLALGVPRIGAHDVGLADRLRHGLGAEPGETPIVIVAGVAAAERLRRSGLRVTMRKDHARVAFHVYNAPADVDRALEAVAS